MKNVSLNRGDICFNYVMPGDTTPTVIVIGRSVEELCITGDGGEKFTFAPSKDEDGTHGVVLEIEKDGCKKVSYICVQEDKDGVWYPCPDFTGECYRLVKTDQGDECNIVEIAQFTDMEG